MAPALALEPLRNGVWCLSAAVLVLAAFVALERAFTFVASARTRRREPVLTRLVYDAIQNSPVGGDQISSLGWLDRRLARSILLGIALDLRGESGDAVTELYGAAGFASEDLARLKSWWASRRAKAAADLGLSRSVDAIPSLTAALDDTDARVRQAAVWALGQAGTPATLRMLVRLLGDRNRIVAQRAQEVLAERGREVASAILSYAESTSSRTGRLAAIELIGWLRLTDGADLLLHFINHLDPEIRVKSVKAAAAIGGPRFISAFHARLEDPSWPVRCQAAKGLSLFGSSESVPRLTKALRDQRWWVRFYAAAALAELGGDGARALSEALQDPKMEVRDLARYLLERGELVPALP